ncbi:hypothetical protein [Streptomyces sp. NPDC048340]|uniref:hypothetical protein n=1 Tax=Streptomyces sp. NPDC048340 TaxID=3365537 RepID=UPI003710EF8D
MQGLTQRLDPGTGWYGEFLRRDPEGMRACLDGAAMPPWDVLESLLGDLAAARGAEFAEREARHAARLRAAAVAVWDRLPGGVEELRTLLAAAAAQRAASETALRVLSVQLAEAVDRAQADAVARELAWTRDDALRAAARHQDLSARLATVLAPPPGTEPLPAVPRQRPAATTPAPPLPAAAPPAPAGPRWGAAPAGTDASAPAGGAWDPAAAPVAPAAEGPWEAAPAGAGAGAAPGGPARPEAGPGAAEPGTGAAPVGRAEGRWLRGARRGGGARYAGAAAPEPPADPVPPGHSEHGTAPRGARFGRPRAEPVPPGHPEHAAAPRGAGHAPAEPEPDPDPAGPAPDAVGDLVARLVALRAQGRSGEAHALLCVAAAWPAGRLPDLAAELTRAGLAADWATLLWEVASLPPEHLAAAAAVLGEAGRAADCDALLRQGAARPPAEIAEAALALGAAGRTREADALLGAFVRLRTAEESARLARRDPQWFGPRLLRAAEALPGTHHRDLVHALRVAKPPSS